MNFRKSNYHLQTLSIDIFIEKKYKDKQKYKKNGVFCYCNFHSSACKTNTSTKVGRERERKVVISILYIRRLWLFHFFSFSFFFSMHPAIHSTFILYTSSGSIYCSQLQKTINESFGLQQRDRFLDYYYYYYYFTADSNFQRNEGSGGV